MDVTQYLQNNRLFETKLDGNIGIQKDDEEGEYEEYVEELRVNDAHYFSSVCESVHKWRHDIQSNHERW